MYIILAIGALIAIINVILTYQELIPFFKAMKQLNDFTSKGKFIDRFLYLFRFCTLIPKLLPLGMDILVAVVCGMIGMSGGVFGALIGITMGFTASLLIKFNRYFIMPKIKTRSNTWKVI